MLSILLKTKLHHPLYVSFKFINVGIITTLKTQNHYEDGGNLPAGTAMSPGGHRDRESSTFLIEKTIKLAWMPSKKPNKNGGWYKQ